MNTNQPSNQPNTQNPNTQLPQTFDHPQSGPPTCEPSTQPGPNPIDRIRKDLDAIDPATVRRPNAHVHQAVAIARRNLPNVLPHRDRLAALPDFDAHALDRVSAIADALDIAQYQCEVFDEPEGVETSALSTEAFQLRRRFTKSLDALAESGRLGDHWVASLSGSNDRALLAQDLGRVAELLELRHPELLTLTPMSREEVVRARKLQVALQMAEDGKAKTPAMRAEAADVRDRAWTLLWTTWNQVRRGLTFVRWDEGDADQLAPALTANRRRGGNTDADEEPGPTGAAAAPTPPSGKDTGPVVQTTVHAPTGAAGYVPAPLNPFLGPEKR